MLSQLIGAGVPLPLGEEWSQVLVGEDTRGHPLDGGRDSGYTGEGKGEIGRAHV